MRGTWVVVIKLPFQKERKQVAACQEMGMATKVVSV